MDKTELQYKMFKWSPAFKVIYIVMVKIDTLIP